MVVERDISRIIIDGKKSRSYERHIKKVLRDKGISVKKLGTARDEAYPALRIADAIAGLARYRADNPHDANADELYQRIAKKVRIVLEE